MASWRLEYSIDVDVANAVVYIKVHGQWSTEVAEAYHKDFKDDMEPLLGKPWAKIVDLCGWKVSRDEVTSIIGKHMQWSKDNKVALSIYVLNNPAAYRQLNEMFESGGTKKISRTFRTYPEAEDYLKKRWIDKREK